MVRKQRNRNTADNESQKRNNDDLFHCIASFCKSILIKNLKPQNPTLIFRWMDSQMPCCTLPSRSASSTAPLCRGADLPGSWETYSSPPTASCTFSDRR